MFRWVDDTPTNGILVFEPCDNGVQFFVRRQLEKRRANLQVGELGVSA